MLRLLIAASLEKKKKETKVKILRNVICFTMLCRSSRTQGRTQFGVLKLFIIEIVFIIIVILIERSVNSFLQKQKCRICGRFLE